jgi:peptidoglycan/xylan/chitin deacetylase (PgdA/CDA1 family)
MAGTLLIGYDVEWLAEGNVTVPFLQRAQHLHNALNAPATMFLVGMTLERWVPDFQRIAADPLFDIQQHTWSHQLLKTVHIDDGKSVRVVRGIPLPEIRTEVLRTSDLIRNVLGKEVTGITGPFNYYRGLRDRPEILESLYECGIRFTRCDGRNAQDWHPVSMDLQPYWYDCHGFGDVLEIPIHGWHDCVYRDVVIGWDDLQGYVDSVTPYLDRAAAQDEVFSLCQHDWSSIRADPDMRATEAIIHYAQDHGLRIMTYLDYYQEQLAERAGQATLAAVAD